jgi:hypothetical protein
MPHLMWLAEVLLHGCHIIVPNANFHMFRRFEDPSAVVMKNSVFWDILPCKGKGKIVPVLNQLSTML